MKKALLLVIVVASASASAMAIAGTQVPEISPAVIPTAVALLGGSILVARSFLKKK